jgi:hypothetical protein
VDHLSAVPQVRRSSPSSKRAPNPIILFSFQLFFLPLAEIQYLFSLKSLPVELYLFRVLRERLIFSGHQL